MADDSRETAKPTTSQEKDDCTPSTSTPIAESHNRVFAENFKNILSSVLKTDLGQVLKNRGDQSTRSSFGSKPSNSTSEIAIETDELGTRFSIRDGENKKGNTARKTGPKPVINSATVNRSFSGGTITIRGSTIRSFITGKRKLKKFKGGTYQLPSERQKKQRKKRFLGTESLSFHAERDEMNSDEESEFEGDRMECDDGNYDNLRNNTQERPLSEKSLTNTWTNIELPTRDVVTWMKPSNSLDNGNKGTWFDFANGHVSNKENNRDVGFTSTVRANGDVTINSNQENVLCTCREEISVPVSEPVTPKEIFCQAVDCIDERLVGCCNIVAKPSWRRPARKIPFVHMCIVHEKRLQAHHCCPGCGLFCTQGAFMRCQMGETDTIHLFHERCCVVYEGEALCPHCGGSSDWIHVRTRLNSSRPLTFLTKQQTTPKSPSARMTIIRTNEIPDSSKQVEVSSSTSASVASYKIVETGKEISSDGLPMGPDRSQLESLLRNLSMEKPMNLRYTVKSFYNAAKSGDVEKILHMIAMNFNPNHKYEEHDNESALHAACANGHLITVHVLQQAGADLDCVDNRLSTPLTAAVENKQAVIVQYLIRAGVNLEMRGEDGMTCLHIAAKFGNFEACRAFLESGKINVNNQDDGGWTPLIWAAEFRHKDIVRFLIERGGDPNIRDNELNVALHWAAFSGSLEICELFLNRGSELSSQNEHGDTPLHIAARQDNYDCIILFLTRNADISVRNKEGETPMMCCPDENTQSWMALSMSLQLKHFARSCMGRSEHILHRDISYGKEMNPIQCVNGVDDEPFPTDYLYVVENCETVAINVDRCITSLQSCVCEDDCSTSNCICSSLSLKCWFTKEGGLVPEFNLLDPPMIFECNRACRCWKNCNNRIVQHGIMSRLQLFRTKGKGWGVRTLRDIPQGTFVCEYIGEIISDSEADQREDDSYLFDLDNRDGETYCLDARHYGNVSRFINHLCEPNLVPVKVFVDHQDLRFPRIAFFSSRDIKVYEELGFDYGEKFWIIKYKAFTCMCNAERCKYSSSKIQEMLENYNRRQREDVNP